MSVSNYGEDLLMAALPGTVYVKLHLGDPGEAGTANPATETTRKSVTLAASSGGTRATSTDADWTTYPAAETVSHWSIWDASTAGNCLWTGALTASKTLGTGDEIKISAGSLTVTVD